MSAPSTVRVMLPYHLRLLARVEGDVAVEVAGPVTPRSILDALEARYPALCGTIREHGTLERRAYVRYFACQEDWSHQAADAELPPAVAAGEEPFMVIGALAGG